MISGSMNAPSTVSLCLALALPAVGQDAPGQDSIGEGAARLAELQPRIDKAIDRGVDHLVSTQLLDGSWPELRALEVRVIDREGPGQSKPGALSSVGFAEVELQLRRAK